MGIPSDVNVASCEIPELAMEGSSSENHLYIIYIYYE